LQSKRLYAFTSKAPQVYTDIQYGEDDGFVFGAEAAGLPEKVLGEFPAERLVRLPMRPGNRSLNLSNAVAVVVYEAWRQQGFK
jgi:tRNA (cytidine/uridine-2'-O-)-methyltransferase